MSFIINPYRFASGGADPNFGSVVLLCHFDGADGATTATDEKGHALTFNGNAQLDTAQSKFGTASLLLDGTGDYVSALDSADWFFGLNENFTIEGFVRFNNKDANSGTQILISQYTNTGDQRSFYLRLTTGNKLTFFVSATGLGTLFLSEGAWTPSNNVWYYVGAERSGTTVRVWADTAVIGTASSGVTNNAFKDSTAPLRFGALDSSGATQFLNGWLDEWRITKGVARYNGTYVVPTAAFPNS